MGSGVSARCDDVADWLTEVSGVSRPEQPLDPMEVYEGAKRLLVVEGDESCISNGPGEGTMGDSAITNHSND